MTLGERIGAARKRRGLSQAQVAERLDVSRQAVSKWETDTSRPDMENLLHLAELFDMPLEELAMERTAPEKKRPSVRLWVCLGVLLLAGALAVGLHVAPVDLEAGGPSWQSEERAQRYAQKLFDRYEEQLLEWAYAMAPDVEGAGLVPDSLRCSWSGRTLTLTYTVGPSEQVFYDSARGESVRYSAQVILYGTRIWPNVFRWDEFSVNLLETSE